MSSASESADPEKRRQQLRALTIAQIAAIESAVERDEKIKEAKSKFGWSVKSLREDVDKARARVKQDAAKKRAAEAKPEEGRKPTLMTATQAITLFNATYAVIRVEGKVRILVEDTDADGRPTFALLSEKDFKTHTANKGAVVVPGGEKDAYVPANDYWLQSPDRREYSGIVFRPGEEMKITPGANWPWPKFYNLWRGWDVEPGEAGSCERFKRHLLDNVCNGDAAHYDWLWKWMAHIFQRPQEKPGVAVALRGVIGCGKTIVGKTIGKLVSLRHYVIVSQQSQLIGKFNQHMASSLLTQAEEAVWVHDPGAVGHMKDLITNTRRALEPKGVDVVMVDAFDRLFMTSNETTMVPAEKGERRYYVLDVNERRARDTAYFAAMEDELKAGGYERLMWELLQTDLTGFDCRTCPETAALAEQKKNNLPFVAKWMLDRLIDGELWNLANEPELEDDGDKPEDSTALFRSSPGVSDIKPQVVLKSAVRSDYLGHCRALTHKTHMSEEQLTKQLKEHLGFKPARQRCRGARKQVYILPSLEEARARFIKSFELDPDIFDETSDEDDKNARDTRGTSMAGE